MMKLPISSADNPLLPNLLRSGFAKRRVYYWKNFRVFCPILKNFIKRSKLLTYVGFRKTHPHNSDSFIRLAWKSVRFKNREVKDFIDFGMWQQAIEIYRNIFRRVH